MRKSTIYLPDELKRALERAAESEGTSEATFMRRALERALQEARPPKPRLPLFFVDQPAIGGCGSGAGGSGGPTIFVVHVPVGDPSFSGQ